MRRLARLVVASLVALLGVLHLAPLGALAQDGSGAILTTRADGVVNPVMAGHLEDAVTAAEDGGYQALLVEMDTPGGLDTSMRVIVQAFLTADVPVIVYVAPQGARAASAGAIIAFSAHIAAMSPGTNIGAATPIDLEGGEVIDKVINDAVAYVEAVAEERGRDLEFARETVTDGRSASYSEALEVGAIDLVAANRAELLEALEGTEVELASGDTVTLATAGATVTDYDMAFTRRILSALADPQLAFLLLSVGSLAIIYELASPGGIIGGVIGVIMIVLAFFSLAVLPVDLVGVLLLVLAIALFIAELFVPGVGVFAGGGAIALVFAGLFLFQRPTGVGIDLTFLIPIALAVALAAALIGRYAVRTIRRPAYSGSGGEVVGQLAEVRRADGERLRVLLNGSTWQAVAVEGAPSVGDRVEVVDMDGLILRVRPAEAGAVRTRR